MLLIYSDEYETPEYFSGNVLITDVTPAFTADSSRQASAPSARLMLRGRFQTVDQFNQLHKYQCVIKCAAHTASAPPGQESVAALRREHDMYLEVQRLSGDRQSGCVALYSAHPSYLVLEDHGADLRDLLSTSLRSPQLVLEAVVSAVHALHSLDIMHGDIKPQNMLYKLYDHGYVVKMCDLDAAYKVGETCAADSLGTKNYHAPELRAAALRGESIAAALSIDLFALGLSMWQVVARSSHAALDGSDEGALYADQEALNAHLNYPPIYKKILQSVTAIDPVQRTNMADLSRAIKMLSASSAQQGWLDQKAEHQQLKAAVGDELTSISEKVGVVGSQLGSLDGKVSTVSDQLGSVSLVLNNMDAKLDQVLEDVRSGFDLLASRAVEVGEAMRKEIMLGNQQLQLLPDMIAATQQALDQLSDDSCDQHAEQSENMQECLSFMEASIETAVTHALAAQKVSETGEFQTLVCQLQEQFADLSSEVRTHLQDQRLSSAHTAQLVEDLSETNECLKEGLTELLDSFTAIQAELAELKDNQRALGKQATEVLAGNAELHAMVRALTVNTHGMPTLAIVLPVVAKTWKGKLSPMRLVRNQYVLYFLCSHTHQIAPCGPEAKGYPINVTKQWLLDAAPVLRVGLVLVKTALVLSGLPLPVPDLNALLVDNAMHVQYLDTALGEVSRSASALNSAESATTQVLGAIDAHDNSQLVGVQGAEAEARLQEGSRKAYETIKEVLKADNIVLTCGLRQVVHGGKTAWVLDNDATEHAWKCAVDEAARA